MRFIVVVREIGAGHPKPDYSVEFEAPQLPTIGSYLSITRPSNKYGHTEDLVVRHVWWRLKHPNTSGYSTGAPEVGSVEEILVECDPAIGPSSSDSWRRLYEHHPESSVERFNVSRMQISEAELDKPR